MCMVEFNQAIEYLQEKIKRTHVNHPNANTGCKILKGYTSKIPDLKYLVAEAVSLMYEHICREKRGSPRGETPLTYTSHAIGRFTANYLEVDLDWRNTVRLGDLFIESFYNSEMIDLFYNERRDGKHLIYPIMERNWEAAIIKGSSKDKPEPISKMMQQWQWKDNKSRLKPAMKGKTAKDSHIIRQHRESPWLKGINKLQQTPWMIDATVLQAIKQNPLQKPDDNVDELVKRQYRSKVYERDQIILKADELVGEEFYQYISADYRGRLYYEEPFLNFQGSDWARGMFKFAESKIMTDDGKKWLAIHTACSFNQSYDIDKIPKWAEADYKSYLKEQDLESISVDKFTLDDRIRWCNHNVDLIFDTAENLTIHEKAEKPISFLAACLEFDKMDEEESKGKAYYSHLPIPIDGSNNGWQHLGAISKDTRTGDLVGLIPTEIQRDFYVQTAKELYQITTDERRKEILDKMPMKHIRKGISKRGSMTRAYSAGADKIAENMWVDCRTEDYHNMYGLTEEDCYGFASDLIKAIDIVCPGPLQTMGYLQDLAQYEIGTRLRFKDGEEAEKEFQALRKELNTLWNEYNSKKSQFPKRSKEVDDWKENNRGWYDLLLEKQYRLQEQISQFETIVVEGNGSPILTWNTPSGYPVEYEAYQVRPVETISTISGYNKYNKKSQVKHVGQETSENPDINKYVCGVSPNYIHSLDASHMTLLINEWAGAFGPIHDSFSTHACDVEDLVAATKRVFIKMYDCPNYFDRIRYQLTCNTDNIEQPQLGTLNVQEVKNSDYFFA